MIKLKPFYKVGVAPDVLFLMSEMEVHRLDLDYEPLIRSLQSDSFEPSTTSDKDLERLRYLDSIKVVYNTSEKHPEIINYLELAGVPESFALSQLEHAKVKIINHHRDEIYADALAEELRRYKIKIVDKDPTISFLIVERLNQLRDAPSNSIPVKLGSYRISVGPLLTPMLNAEELARFIEKGKGFFEEEGFLVENMPMPLQNLSVALIAHEIFNIVVLAGTHRAMTAIVEWNLVRMRRSVWPF
jgi:hypothetical protein